MHLPDGRTFRMAITPHPFGGLLFVYADVTDRLVLGRSYSTLIEVQLETINNLHEGVAVQRSGRTSAPVERNSGRDVEVRPRIP